MPKHTTTFACCFVLLAASATLAGSIKEFGRDAPSRYLARWDGQLASVELADGSRWSAWSYRNGAEYDLALAFQGADGQWQPTTFLGLDDGLDQLQPALVVDGAGHLYVSWIDRSGQLSMSIHSAVGSGWSPAAVIASGRQLASPAMSVVGDRLVVAYRDGKSIEICDLPLLDTLVHQGAFGQHGLHDVPDPVTTENPYDDSRKEEEDDRPIEDEDDDAPYNMSPNGNG